MSEYYLTKDELYHHGIKGQKWGQRRWQNEDGSLTPEGREHYGYGNGLIRNTIQMNKDRFKIESGYRSSLKQAKADRKARDKAIQEKYDKGMAQIEKGYKRGQMLSEKDQKRELDLDDKTRQAWAQSKQQYKTERKKAYAEYNKNYNKLAKDFYSNSKYTDFGKGIAAGVALYGVGKIIENKTTSYGAAVVAGLLQGAGQGVALGSGMNLVAKGAYDYRKKH